MWSMDYNELNAQLKCIDQILEHKNTLVWIWCIYHDDIIYWLVDD